jgi:hypothetical protein
MLCSSCRAHDPQARLRRVDPKRASVGLASLNRSMGGRDSRLLRALINGSIDGVAIRSEIEQAIAGVRRAIDLSLAAEAFHIDI